MSRYPQPYQKLIDATQTPTRFDENSRFPGAGHRWSDAERDAVVLAWASRRPLLVRGEPGCGKSQLAHALAQVLGVDIFPEVIHPRFEANDLLYRVDNIERLACAQLLAVRRSGDVDVSKEMDLARFVRPGALWRAMQQTIDAVHQRWPRAVVLIDEIDKADADVPNALLEVLGNRSFTPPGFGTVECSQNSPLIIITTNEDRELPPAFLRRCQVLNLDPPHGEGEAAFCAWMEHRALAHPRIAALDQDDLRHRAARQARADRETERDPEPLLRRAARQVWADRETAREKDLGLVGLAEYLDLLHALAELAQDDAQQAGTMLDDLSRYALVKHRELSQQRPAVGTP
ncbi:MAG: MoxR family ATPase [Rhodanobacteraceae bacterium]|nr:MoxR family ATPase [Rhodanobacteraceae bacterium]